MAEVTRRVDGAGATDGGGRRHLLVSAFLCQPNLGSEESVGWNLPRLHSRHYRVSVITSMRNRGPIEAYLQEQPLPGVRFHYVGLPRWVEATYRGRLGFYLYYLIWQYAAWRRAERIHARDPFDLAHHATVCSLPAPIFLQHLPVRLVFGPVGGGEWAPIRFWGGGGARALVYEVLRTVRLKASRWDPLVQSTLRKADRILALTEDTAHLVPDRYQDRVSLVVGAGIEPSPDRAPRNSPPDAPAGGCRLYTAGRLLQWKGTHLAIRAFARVAQRHPGATFTILGTGPQRARLERLAAAEGVADRVIFRGWVSDQEKVRVTEESDLLLYPSLHDSVGLVVIEAMEAGKPVVCLDWAGPRPVVTPECGIKVPLTTPNQVVGDLAAALDCLMSDASLRRQMGEAARRRVLNEFAWEKRSEKLLAIFRQVEASHTPVGEAPKRSRGPRGAASTLRAQQSGGARGDVGRYSDRHASAPLPQ